MNRLGRGIQLGWGILFMLFYYDSDHGLSRIVLSGTFYISLSNDMVSIVANLFSNIYFLAAELFGEFIDFRLLKFSHMQG